MMPRWIAAWVPVVLVPATLLGCVKVSSVLAEQLETENLPRIRPGFTVQAVDDPRLDGWETEAIAREAEGQLGRLSQLLIAGKQIETTQLKGLITQGFVCDPLVPGKLPVVFRDRSVTVRRADSRSDRVGDRHHGPEGLATALEALWGSTTGDVEVRADFKLFEISQVGSRITTRQFFEFSQNEGAGRRQRNAVWTIGWIQSEYEEPPRMDRIQVDDYEEALTGSSLFADCTSAVLGHNSCFPKQLLRGNNYWTPRIQTVLGLGLFGHQGLAVGDVNGDGLEDVYICQPGGLPNRLFVQNSDGTASDVSRASGVDFLDLTHSVLLIDIDNDGDQDIVLALMQEILLMVNDGRGKFEPKARVTIEGQPTSLAAADYDLDGKLDIYTCVYFDNASTKTLTQFGTPVPYHDATNGGSNVLLRNQGGWRFRDVTDQVGLNHNNTRWSFAASWEDFDNDGDPDLYVANDYGRNNLYRNDGGHFVDVAARAGVEDISAGMAVTWGDYDRDGRMDLYVSNMFSSAGNRITRQGRFKAGTSGDTKAQYRRHARGNSLFRNRGEGRFDDVSLDAGVTMGRWAWASRFLDLNNDGWEDLLVSNGYITNQKIDDL